MPRGPGSKGLILTLVVDDPIYSLGASLAGDIKLEHHGVLLIGRLLGRLELEHVGVDLQRDQAKAVCQDLVLWLAIGWA